MSWIVTLIIFILMRNVILRHVCLFVGWASLIGLTYWLFVADPASNGLIANEYSWNGVHWDYFIWFNIGFAVWFIACLLVDWADRHKS